ncbi:MAG: YibE/F family protein [Vagococcus sp.]|uniref:YibE/F family protein n=1 Tax=Vagococcus sp. TaxID=1933889 RepID=UPI002FC9EDD5
MSVNSVLLLIFILLLWKIGGSKGKLTLAALGFNLLFMFVMLILINWGFPVFPLTLITSILITGMNLFFINGYHLKTQFAFISSLLVLSMMVLLIFMTVRLMHLEGIPNEELMEMDMYSLNIGLSFTSLSVSVMVMSVIGAINDITISITSAIYELNQNVPTLSKQKLVQSGLVIGKDVLGSTMNTLIFALVGGQLALFIWVSDLHYSITQLFNTKILVIEWANLLISGIAISLAIPITTFLMVYRLKRDIS